MNSNRLSLKDFIVIYLLVFSIVIFLAGFFAGAKMMEKRMAVSLENTANEKELYSENEIHTYYTNALLPSRKLIESLYIYNNTTSTNQQVMDSKLQNGQIVLNKLTQLKLKSPSLIEAQQNNIKSIKSILSSVQTGSVDEQKDKIFQEFLYAQANWYQSIWLWEQFQTKNELTNLTYEPSLSWAEWTEANLHQKNYIVSEILAKELIFTLAHPEDITVHIDAYLRANKELSMSMDQLIRLLITSDAIHPADFFDYKDWYTMTKLPALRIFTKD